MVDRGFYAVVSDSDTNKMSLLYLENVLEAYYPSRNDSGQKEPYIFLPHQQRNKFMDPLWKKATEELKQAQKITIIGYSFPEYDQGQMLELFKDVNLQAKWDVIDYEGVCDLREGRKKDVEMKYEKLFRIKPNVYMDGFNGYLSRLKHEASRKHDAFL